MKHEFQRRGAMEDAELTQRYLNLNSTLRTSALLRSSAVKAVGGFVHRGRLGTLDN